MVSCCKCHLTKNKHSKESGVTFHRFPTKDPVYRLLWIGFIGKPNYVPNQYAVMCSQHFEPECFDRSSIAFVRLKEDAIPTREVYRPPIEKSPKSRKQPEPCKVNGNFKIKSEPIEQEEEEHDNYYDSYPIKIKKEPKEYETDSSYESEDSENKKDSSSDDEDNNSEEESEDEGETASSSNDDMESSPPEKSYQVVEHKPVIISQPVTVKHESVEDPKLKKYTLADILSLCRGVDKKDICLFEREKKHENEKSTVKEKNNEINIMNIKEEVSERVIEERKSYCPECNKSEKSWFKSKNNKKYLCRQCHAPYSSISQLQKHLQSHETERHKCKQCSLSFSCRDCLAKHLENYHESDKYECYNCTKHYPKKTQLARHMMMKHGGNKFYCCYCMKCFPYKESLKYHLNKHQGVKFYCAHCPKFVFNKESLKKHLEDHNGMLYPCGKCDKVFRRTDTLKKHEKHIHSEIKPQFKCDQCSRIFSTKGNLNTHLKMHAGLRFNCNYCQKQFMYRQNFKEHILKHEGAKYICKECNIEFSRRGNLLRHIRWDHQPSVIDQIDMLNETYEMTNHKVTNHIDMAIDES